MWPRPCPRSMAIFTLLCSLSVSASAQEVREANAVVIDTGTAEMQYYFLFRRLINPTPAQNRPSPELPDQTNQTSRPRPDFRAMTHRSLGLTDVEAGVLDQIAADCISKTDQLDQQAHEVIAARRAEVRAGKAPPNTPPPSALSDLQKQRDDVIRNAVEQLRAQFGEAEFKRISDQLGRNSGTSSVRIPPPSQKPLAFELKIEVMNRSADSSPATFAAKENFTLEISMLNHSTEMVSIKPSKLLEWLILNSPGRPERVGEVSPIFPFRRALASRPADETAIDLPPNELRVVARLNFGPGAISLSPGQYQLTVHPRVVFDRPDKADFLQLTLTPPFVFEITP
jgi:hypothetical protein